MDRWSAGPDIYTELISVFDKLRFHDLNLLFSGGDNAVTFLMNLADRLRDFVKFLFFGNKLFHDFKQFILALDGASQGG